MESVTSFATSIRKGTFGIEMLAITEPKMRKTNNPFYGRVKKATFMRNVALGVNYSNTINNRLERQGNERTFVSEKPNGKSWVIENLILCKDSDNSVQYLRTQMNRNTFTRVVYLLDERVVDEATEAQIKSFISSSTYSKKQADCGLEGENQVILRDFTTTNIYALSQGEKHYFKDEASQILFQMLKTAFKNMK